MVNIKTMINDIDKPHVKLGVIFVVAFHSVLKLFAMISLGIAILFSQFWLIGFAFNRVAQHGIGGLPLSLLLMSLPLFIIVTIFILLREIQRAPQ